MNDPLGVQMQPPKGVLKKMCSENMQQIYRKTPMPKCDFTKVPKFSCKFAAYLQNTFSSEHLWRAASESTW